MSKSLRETTMKVKFEVDSKALDAADDKLKATAKAAEALEQASNKTGKAVDDTGRSLKDTADSAKTNADETKKAAEQSESLESANRRTTQATRETTGSLNENAESANGLRGQYEDLGRAQDPLRASFQQTDQAINQSSSRLSGWSDSLSEVSDTLGGLSEQFAETGEEISGFGQNLVATFGAMSAVGGAGIGYAVKKAADFEQAMADAKALMAPDEWKQYGSQFSDLVVKLGADTKYSSVEVATGLQEMIKAGVDLDETLKGGLKDSLSLATAGELELADAAEVASTVLNAFRKDNIDMARASDILAGAANASATSVGELKYSLSMAASVASGVGFSFEDTSTALAVFAQNGLKGSDAGTSLKTMLQRLSPQTSAAYDAMAMLGLATKNTTAGYKFLVDQGLNPVSRTTADLESAFMSLAKQELGAGASKAKINKEYDKLLKSSGYLSSSFYDEQGNVKSMSEVFDLLATSTSKLSNEQRQNALNTIFGTDAIRAALIASDNGKKSFEDMGVAINKISAEAVAEEKMNTLKGSIERASGAAETAATTFGTALIPMITDLADKAESLIDWFNGMDKSTQQSLAKWAAVGVGITAVATAIGFVAIGVGGLISGFGRVLSAGRTLTGWMSSGAGWLGRYRTATDSSTSAVNRETSSILANTRALRINQATRARITGRAPIPASAPMYGPSPAPVQGPGVYGPVQPISPASAPMYGPGVYGPMPAPPPAPGKWKTALTAGRQALTGGGGKALPLVGTAIAATSLIGTTKENVGENVGGFSGSLAGGLAGAATGAALGSVVPVIGTAIGGAVGGIAGSLAGTKLGSEMGKSFQKHWPDIKKKVQDFSDKHPIVAKALVYSNPVTAGASASKSKYDSVETLSTKVDFGENVSKQTAKAYSSYKKFTDKSAAELQYFAYSGEKITKKASEGIAKNYDSASKTIENRLDKSAKDTKSNLKKLVTNGVLGSEEMKSIQTAQDYNLKKQRDSVKKTNDAIQKANKDMYKESKKITTDAEKEINEIKKKAAKEGRTLTKKEQRDIKNIEEVAAEERKMIHKKYKSEIELLQQQQNRNAAKTLSKSAKEQRTILTVLGEDSSRISAKQASDVVKQSKRAKDGAVKEANKKYKDVVAAADAEYYENGSITKAQRDDIIKKAKEQRDGAVEQAEDMHLKVVEQAQKQADGHIRQVDWETGKILTQWDLHKVSLAKIVNGITGGINTVLKFLNIPEIPEWKTAGAGSASAADRASRATGKVSGALEARATGTASATGGATLVGEEGVELGYKPFSGEAYLLGANGPEIAHVEPGTRILNHTDTKSVMSGGMGKGISLPGYSTGNSTVDDFKASAKKVTGKAMDGIKNVASDTWSAAKDTASAVGDFAGDASDWIMHPIENTKKLFSKYLPFGGAEIGPKGNGLGTGILKHLQKGVGGYLEKQMESMGLMGGIDFGGAFTRTSGFGPRWGTMHKGVDYAAPVGTPIPSQSGGTVASAGFGVAGSGFGGYGNYVMINGGGGLSYLYGHNSKNLVSKGDSVSKGQIIGLVGSTGDSTGPHVHFEVRKNGVAINPDSVGGFTGGAGSSKQMKAWVSAGMARAGVSGSNWANGLAWIAQKESSGDPRSVGAPTSDGRAKGLMQLKPFNIKGDPFDPINNMNYGIKYIQKRYGTIEKALSWWRSHNWYKRGTNHHNGGPAVLGDDWKNELFETPDGKVGISPAMPTMMNLPQGSKVKSGEETERILNQPRKQDAAQPVINFNPTFNITVQASNSEPDSNVIKRAIKEAQEEMFRELRGLFTSGVAY